jgi:hypothetical protein
MTYAFVQVLPDLTPERYARVVAALGDGPFEGLVVHLAGPCEAGWRIIQVWRSAQDYSRFARAALWPALGSSGALAGASPPLFEWLEVAHVVVGEPAPSAGGGS